MAYKSYIVMPERCQFSTVDAQNAEIACRLVCSDYSPKTPIAILDTATGETVIFTSELDRSGNLLRIKRHAQLE